MQQRAGKAVHRVKAAFILTLQTQNKEREEILAHCTSDNRLISRRYKELKELNNAKSNESISRLMRQTVLKRWETNGQ